MDVILNGEATKVKPAEEITEKGFYFLCNLDQNTAVIMRNVYFYESPGRALRTVEETVQDSLSKVLVPYHPLSGRLGISPDGKLTVELTGEGVDFVVAEANFGLNELLAKPLPQTLLKLVYDVKGANLLEIPLMTIQLTKFTCGGFAIGTCMTHCMADGISVVGFGDSWDHVARHGLPLPSPPFLDRSILKARDPPRPEYPHLEFLDIDDVSGCGALYEAELMETRTLVFDVAKIGRLKEMAMEGGGVIKCSTFEVLSAFVWRARSKALRMASDQRTKLLFAVDGRSRFNPPLPKGFFGNGIVLTRALCTTEELVDKPLAEGVKRVQEAIAMVTDEYMRSAIDYFEKTRARPSLTSTILISSWSRLSFNSMDFGSGPAIYFGPVWLPGREFVLFQPHGPDPKSISVHLGLPRSAMDTFRQLVDEI